MPAYAPRLPTRAAAREPRRRDERSPAPFPLRDWKRAFAVVDRLNAEFRGFSWFRGVRAFWDRHKDEIAIEVQVGGPAMAAAAALIPADLRGRTILFRDTK